MVSNSAKQHIWPFSTSPLVCSKAEYHSGYYTVSGHNSRYSTQMRRKRQCCFRSTMETDRNALHIKLCFSLKACDLHSSYDMQFPKDGAPTQPCCRSSAADKAHKEMRFAVLMPLTPLTPSLLILQTPHFPSSPCPAFSSDGTENLSDCAGTFHSLLMVGLHLAFWTCWLLAVLSEVTFPLAAYAK